MILETKSAQSTEIYLGVSASVSYVYNSNLKTNQVNFLIICFASLMQQRSFFVVVVKQRQCRQPHFRAHLVSKHYCLTPGTNVFTP